MFNKCDFKALELNDNSTFVGIIRYNDHIIPKQRFLRPFIRDCSMKQIIKIGKRDYNKSDQFISAALNDYYKRISTSPEAERNNMITNYNRLYQSWTILNQSKINRNYKTMEDCYDSLSYQLYLLGYKMADN